MGSKGQVNWLRHNPPQMPSAVASAHCSLLPFTEEGRTATQEVPSLCDFRRGPRGWGNSQEATMGTIQTEGLQEPVSQLWLMELQGEQREGMPRAATVPHLGKF